jgi:hypothetical protein
MNQKTIGTIRRHARMAFMAAVTAAMLALTFEHARRGLAGLDTAAAYALTVGFGLEFLAAGWTGGRDDGRRTQLERH